jgi:tRNA 5-methylaminomethyl-2-thiouridine biosynthesis bifunctional protein
VIEPARIDFDAGGAPFAPDFGDVYHPQVGAADQARHVFLAGNGLPERWRGGERFVILETGFGLGNNFLAAWQAWRDDAARCPRLHFVSIERHPPRREDLARAHASSPWPVLAAQLVAAWPPLTPDLHRLDFDGGAVRLLLAFGDVADVLPELDLAADAVFLDGFAPAKNPAMWTPAVLKAIGRRCAANATAATWSVAREVRAGLAVAGFEVERVPGIGGKRETTRARFAPRFPLSIRVAGPGRDALVVGAGLAGVATARALAAEGFAVTLLDRRPQAGAEGSSQPGGLFHGTVHRDDGPHARLLRAAALVAQREVRSALGAGVPGQQQGLLRLGARPELVESQRLPADWVEALDAAAASARAGVPVSEPAWWFPGGGWVAPAALAAWWLADPALRFIGGAAVARIERDGSRWLALDDAGGLLAAASRVVVAAAGDTQRLLAPLGFEVSLAAERGQTSGWRDGHSPPLRCPLAGDGYALPLPDGLLCGATSSFDDEPAPRAEDDTLNFRRLERLTGLAPPPHRYQPIGRVGWRWSTPDKLPLTGLVPMGQASRLQAAFARWPRHPGLYVNAGLGGRGLTWAPLLGRVIAAHASGTPLPLPRSLLDAIDPLRFRLRGLRRAASSY